MWLETPNGRMMMIDEQMDGCWLEKCLDPDVVGKEEARVGFSSVWAKGGGVCSKKRGLAYQIEELSTRICC